MYLDTDVVLALIKEEDWLKADAEAAVGGVEDRRTSALTVIEAQLVLEREVSRDAALDVDEQVRGEEIQLLPVDAEVLQQATRIRTEHPEAGIFDAIHLATARLADETILSSDRLFPLLDIVPVETLP